MENFKVRDIAFYRIGLSIFVVAALAIQANTLAVAQQNAVSAQPSQIHFEVASIKPHKAANDVVVLNYSPDGFLAAYTTVRMLVRMAYGPIDDNRIVVEQEWVNTERFDIEAKVDSSEVDFLQNLSPAQLRGERQRMLQALLAERFGLAVRRDKKELPVYALVVGKNGPKFHAATPGDTYPNGFKQADGRGGVGLYGGVDGQLIGQAAPMQTLAVMLSQRLGRIVLDKTGLTGGYDFKLLWSPEQAVAPVASATDGGEQGNGTAPSAEFSNPSIFDALQQQLGLKLESQKAPVDVLVVDHVQRPSGN